MFECLEFEECQYNAQPKCCLPDGVECPHGVKVHKPTNADRVRAMSDEELAHLLCFEGWQMSEVQECLEWLQQPAEEDT